MANPNLFVLEGLGESFSGRRRKEFSVHRGNRTSHMSGVRVPGILYGDPIQMLGIGLTSPNPNIERKNRELQLKAAKAKGVKFTADEEKKWINGSYSADLLKKIGYTKSSGNFLEQAAKSVADAGSTVVRATQSNVLRPTAHVVATGTRATVRAVGDVLDVTRRMAKRAIKAVAKKVLFKGGFLGASAVAAVPKNAAKGILIPAATAAVLANPATAAAAPAVPVLVNEVIDELYNNISDQVAKGLSPDNAAAKAKSDLDKLAPGEENDPKAGIGPVLLLVGGGLLAYVLARRR